MIYILNMANGMNKETNVLVLSLDGLKSLLTTFQETIQKPEQLFNKTAFLVFVGWIFFQALLQVILPAEMASGVELPSKKRLKYPMNAHLAFWVTLGILAIGYPNIQDG